jgi:hypothetical protein
MSLGGWWLAPSGGENVAEGQLGFERRSGHEARENRSLSLHWDELDVDQLLVQQLAGCRGGRRIDA